MQLAEIEQIVYAAHYDQDAVRGNPRQGWVKVGLVRDLSVISGEEVHRQSLGLHKRWSDEWAGLGTDRTSADAIVKAIDKRT